MNDSELDKLFIDTFSQDQHFSRKNEQWLVVQKEIKQNKRSFIYWIIGISCLMFLLLILFYPYANTIETYSEKEIKTEEVDLMSKAIDPSFSNQEQKTSAFLADETAENETTNTSSIPYKKINNTVAVNRTNKLNAINKLETQTTSTNNSILLEKNESLESTYTTYTKYNDSYSFNTISKHSIGQVKAMDPLLFSSEDQKTITFLRTGQLHPISSSVTDKGEVLADRIYIVDNQSIPLIGNPKTNPFSIEIFAGLSYNFTSNTDLVYTKKYSPKIGLQYNLNRFIGLRAIYQYRPMEVIVQSNVENYDIDYGGSYEPLNWNKSTVNGLSHNLTIGASFNKRFNKWEPFITTNMDIQMLQDFSETHILNSAYEEISIHQEVDNTSHLARFYPGIGIKYHWYKTAISLEYEYYFPTKTLYNWKGLQNINLFVHYKF